MALEVADRFLPAIGVLDIGLPVMDGNHTLIAGLHVVGRLEHPSHHDPVCLLTMTI
jgi:hypothetical protein